MWESIFAAMVGAGGFWSWKASSAQDAEQSDQGVDELAPRGERPLLGRQDALSAAIAGRWRANLVFGLSLLAVGVTGTVVRIVDDVSVSREQFIETVSSAPGNARTRNELSCYFDMYERAGVAIGSTTEDEVAASVADAFVRMSEAEQKSFQACVGERTTAERQTSLDAMSDAHIRDLLIGAMAADPTAGLRRRDAECIVGYLDQQGVIREMLLAEGTMSPELAAVQEAAGVACF